MATEAMIGYSTVIEVETTAGSGTFTELGEVTSVTPPEDTVDQIDVTHMGSPGRRREYISGLIDGGEGSFDLNWVPGAATHDFIVAWQAAGDTRDVRISERPTASAYRGHRSSSGARRPLPATQVAEDPQTPVTRRR